MKRILKWLVRLVLGVVLFAVGLLFFRAFASRSKPPLKPWHQVLAGEFRAKDLTDERP